PPCRLVRGRADAMASPPSRWGLSPPDESPAKLAGGLLEIGTSSAPRAGGCVRRREGGCTSKPRLGLLGRVDTARAGGSAEKGFGGAGGAPLRRAHDPPPRRPRDAVADGARAARVEARHAAPGREREGPELPGRLRRAVGAPARGHAVVVVAQRGRHG